jgi:hypothetical protein
MRLETIVAHLPPKPGSWRSTDSRASGENVTEESVWRLELCTIFKTGFDPLLRSKPVVTSSDV